MQQQSLGANYDVLHTIAFNALIRSNLFPSRPDSETTDQHICLLGGDMPSRAPRLNTTLRSQATETLALPKQRKQQENTGACIDTTLFQVQEEDLGKSSGSGGEQQNTSSDLYLLPAIWQTQNKF